MPYFSLPFFNFVYLRNDGSIVALSMVIWGSELGWCDVLGGMLEKMTTAQRQRQGFQEGQPEGQQPGQHRHQGLKEGQPEGQQPGQRRQQWLQEGPREGWQPGQCRWQGCEDKLSLLSCVLSLDSAFSSLASMHAVDPSTSLFLHPLTGPCWSDN